MERIPGQRLEDLNNMTHRPDFPSFAQVFDYALMIHDLLDLLRAPTEGVSLWHLDATLNNLLVYHHGDDHAGNNGFSLAVVDYNQARVCCVDNECDRLIDDLSVSMRSMQLRISHAKISRSIKRCSSFHNLTAPDCSYCSYYQYLDGSLVATWIKDMISLLAGPMFDIHDLSVDVDLAKLDLGTHLQIRQDYQEEWTKACASHGEVCQSLLRELSRTSQWAQRNDSAELNLRPYWKNSTQALVQSLHAAKDSVVQ